MNGYLVHRWGRGIWFAGTSTCVAASATVLATVVPCVREYSIDCCTWAVQHGVIADPSADCATAAPGTDCAYLVVNAQSVPKVRPAEQDEPGRTGAVTAPAKNATCEIRFFYCKDGECTGGPRTPGVSGYVCEALQENANSAECKG